ncbi:MAG: dienelactone hydrolase [Halioglobus sp.]
MKTVVLYPLLVLILLVGCSDGTDMSAVTETIEPPDLPAISYDEQGPYPVGNQTISVMNASRGRMLDVEIWYPANITGSGQSILDFAGSEAERDALQQLLADVPQNCTRRETNSSASPEPIITIPFKLPLVVFSHCYECTRYSLFSLAERLASHGIAFAAPDHAMNTLFDSGAMINAEFLATRASDISAVLDELLIDNSQALPVSLQGRFDATKIGVAGHSYGAVTAGKVLQDDDRFKAGLIIAAPVESPVLLGVTVEQITEPMLFMLAQEDNSIGLLGNAVMRQNYDVAPSPAWKIEMADAGHWSFSDIARIVPAFDAGCGDGERQSVPGEPFTYIDNVLAREITAAYGVRFFAAQLLGDEEAALALSISLDPGVVDVQSK